MEATAIVLAQELFHKVNQGTMLSTNINDVVEISNFLVNHGDEVRESDCYLFAVLLGFVDFGRDIFKDEILYKL
jgi:hypothetical protein